MPNSRIGFFTVIKIIGVAGLLLSILMDQGFSGRMREYFLFGLLSGGLLVDIGHDLVKRK